MKMDNYESMTPYSDPYIDPSFYDDMGYYDPDYGIEQEKKQGNWDSRIYSAILCALYILGFCVPYFFNFPLGIVKGSIIGGIGEFAIEKSPLQFLFDIITTGTICGGEIQYNWLFGLYTLFLTVMFLGVIITMIGSFVDSKHTNAWTFFCSSFAAMGIVGYRSFCSFGSFDFIMIAAVLAVIVFIIEAIRLSKRGAVIPLISLALLSGYAVLSYQESITSVGQAMIHFYIMLMGNTQFYDPIAFAPFMLMAYTTGAFIMVNIVLSILQIATMRRTTLFTIVRYAIGLLLTCTTLFMTIGATGVGIGDLPFILLLFVIMTVLSVIAVLAYYTNYKALHQEDEEPAPAVADVPAAAPAAAPQAVPAQQQTVAPNVFIIGDPKGSSLDGSASPIVKMFSANGTETKQLYSDGFVGSVNVVNGNQTPDRLPMPTFQKSLGKIYAVLAAAFSVLSVLFVLFSTALGSQHFASVPAGFITVVLALLFSGTAAFAILTYLYKEQLYAIASAVGAGLSLIVYFLFEVAFADGISLGSVPVMLSTIAALIFAFLSIFSLDKGVNTFFLSQDSTVGRFDSASFDDNSPYRYMGESVSNADAPTQDELPSQTAPVLDAEEKAALLASSTLDEVTATLTAEAEEELAIAETEEAEEEPVEEFIDENFDEDPFLMNLSDEDRKEFVKVFLCREALGFLPPYEVGKANLQFFHNAFIYLSKTRQSISDSLLEAMYTYINSH